MLTATPSTKEAQAIADELYADFVSQVRRLPPAVAACQGGAREAPCTALAATGMCTCLLWLGGFPALLGAQDVDKVELVYTKFVSLISSEPTIQTLLPLTPQARPAGPLTGACGKKEGLELGLEGYSGCPAWQEAVWAGLA